ncbi:MAG TPA: oligosaccharide flippase family protein [Gemmatimonadales bacterium]|nr:oligosaccharide flippase family protein [Gemmatimonadales bacterium]
MGFAPADTGSRAVGPTGVDGFRRLIGNSAWLLSANAAALGLGFLQMLILARVLGPTPYGLLALVMTYPATVNQVFDSRAWEAATSYLVRYRAEGNAAKAAAVAKLCYLVDATTALLALLVVVVSAPWAARVFLKDPALSPLVMAFAVTILAGVPAGTSLVLLRVAGRFRLVALQNLLNASLRFAAVVTALFVVGSLQAVVGAYVVAMLAGALVSIWMGRVGARAVGLGGLRVILAARLDLLRGDGGGIARFLTITNVNGLLKVAQRQGDILLVGYYLGPAAAGFIRLARSFSDLLNVPVAPVYEASYPTFASLWRHRQVSELRRLARRVTQSSAAFGLAGALVLVVAGGTLLRLTAGAQYGPATVPLQLFAAATGLAVSTSVWHPLLVAMDRPGRSLVAMAAGVIVQLAVLVAGVSLLGASAAGVAYLAFYLTWIPIVGLTLLSVHRHVRA